MPIMFRKRLKIFQESKKKKQNIQKSALKEHPPILNLSLPETKWELTIFVGLAGY